MLWHGVFVLYIQNSTKLSIGICMKTINTKIIINNVLNNDICDASKQQLDVSVNQANT